MKTYRDLEYKDDFEGISKSFVETSHKNNIMVEDDPQKAKHMIKNDLRDAIPPQLFALISKITAAIESVADVKQISHTSEGENKV